MVCRFGKYQMRWNEIFTESQQLNELFDKIATWDWTDVYEFGREAAFEVNGTPYRVKLWTDPQAPGMWDAEFVNMSVWSSRWGNTGTMENEGIQVFGTVIAIIKKFVAEVEPKGLMFSGYVDEKRDHLYTNMIKHQTAELKRLGYKVDAKHKGSHIEFELTREAKAASEQQPEQES